jgi:hypothetical protein
MNLVYSLRVNSADPAQPDTQQRVSDIAAPPDSGRMATIRE